MTYFDTAYLAKCYLPEDGHREVRSLAEKAGRVHSAAFTRIELAAVLHRHLREGRLRAKDVAEHLDPFDQDCADRVVTLTTVAPALIQTAAAVYRRLARTLFLRSADCLHLCAAAETGFKKIYSNNRHLLAAARHFKLEGINVLPDA
jgi:predicted nucleic acid-binding protein